MSIGNDNMGVDYSHAFLSLTEAVAEKDINAVRQYAKKTMDFAKALKRPDLEISVLCMAATGFLSVGQLSTALKLYDEADKIANDAEANETESDFYKQLAVQILLYRGSSLLTQHPPQYNAITEVYQQAADKLDTMIADKGKPEAADWMDGGVLYLYLYESLRIMGYCQEQLGRQQAALKHYVKAVNAAEKLGKNMRKSTPIDIVGKALLSLCRKLGMKKEYFIVIDKMNGLLGEGWEKEAANAVA